MKKILFFLSFTLSVIFSNNVLADTFYIDVRTPAEYQEKSIEGTINIPHNEILSGMSQHNIKKEDKIVLFCRSGKRAGVALTNLKLAGYKDVTNIGGFEDAKTILNK